MDETGRQAQFGFPHIAFCDQFLFQGFFLNNREIAHGIGLDFGLLFRHAGGFQSLVITQRVKSRLWHFHYSLENFAFKILQILNAALPSFQPQPS